MGVTETIAGIFGFGILAYFTWKVILPGLQNVGSLQPPPQQQQQIPHQTPEPGEDEPGTPSLTPQERQKQQQPQQKTNFTPTNSNITAPNVAGTAFTFNMVGCINHTTPTGQNLCGDNPSLALVLGDFAYDCNAQQWWTGSMKACVGKNVIASVGNHDCNGKGFINLWPANGGKWEFIKKMGNIAFIAVNTGFCSGTCSNPSTSEPLFKQAQADPSVKWIIVHQHKPFFTKGVKPDAPMSYHEMYRKYPKVKMVLHAHNHTYARYTPIDGIQYVTCGQGGHAGNNSGVKGPSSGTIGVGKCRVGVDGSITCQYVANNGEILDSWGLTAQGKHTGTGGISPAQKAPASSALALAQSFYATIDPLEYQDKEDRDNAVIKMIDEYDLKVNPRRKFNKPIYHYSVLKRRRRRRI